MIATRGWGGAPSGGVASLIDPETLPGLREADGGDGSLGLEMAWGTDLSGWRHGMTGSAYGRVSGRPGVEDLRLGWRIATGARSRRGPRPRHLAGARAGERGRHRRGPELVGGAEARAVLDGPRPARGHGRRHRDRDRHEMGMVTAPAAKPVRAAPPRPPGSAPSLGSGDAGSEGDKGCLERERPTDHPFPRSLERCPRRSPTRRRTPATTVRFSSDGTHGHSARLARPRRKT